MFRCSDLAPFALGRRARSFGCRCRAGCAANRRTGRSAFGFGKPATPAEIAGWDIDVRPDGTGLPPGRGSVAQGQQIYDAKCASCHGTFGESTDYLALAGGVGSLGTSQPVRTTGSKLNYATTLFDYIRRAMPFPNPKTLTDHEVYALTAYVLNLNDILPADAVLDRESLPKVKMPNRDGFTTDARLHAPRRQTRHAQRGVHAQLRRDRATVLRDARLRARLARQPRRADARSRPGRGGAHGSAGRGRRRRRGAELARKAGCMACHAVTTKVVGPAFRDVAARYSGDAGAQARLLQKIRTGGSGAWGDMPMPPQTVPEPEAKAVLTWVLSGAP